MSARRKLNGAHVLGSLIVAALMGLLTGSWLVFLLTMAVLMVIDLISGNIRPNSGGR